ncbi:MAG: DM13 domain-containing protein [Leptolyngbyaceae cyanobacterium]
MLTSRFTLGCVMLCATMLATACTASPDASTTDSDAAPTTEPTQSADSATPTEPAEPVVRTGTFVSAEHDTTGGVELISDGGQQALRFDDSFSSSDGPDLVVVLHRSPDVLAATSPPAYPIDEADYVVIAPLAATTGAQDYVVPAEIDLESFASVAVWCQEFNATFGVATLQ